MKPLGISPFPKAWRKTRDHFWNQLVPLPVPPLPTLRTSRQIWPLVELLQGQNSTHHSPWGPFPFGAVQTGKLGGGVCTPVQPSPMLVWPHTDHVYF